MTPGPAHRSVLHAFADRGVVLVVCGSAFQSAAADSPVACHCLSSAREAADWAVDSVLRDGDVVLVKGSRGMKMEEAVRVIAEKR